MAVCAGILSSWIDATPWMPRVHSTGEVERYYRETVFAERSVVVAEREVEIAGFLTFSDDHLVTALYVDERHRGTGVGAALLGVAKKRSGTELRLWTFEHNTRAQRFYVREGFVPAGRTAGENEEGLPDILYLWRAELPRGREAFHA